MSLKANKLAPGDSSGPPRHVFNLAYLVYFSLGAGLLLLWNWFITAVDYFDFLYANTHIDRIFNVSYVFPGFIVLLFLTFYGQRYTAWIRINGGLLLFPIPINLMVFLDSIFIEEGSRGSAPKVE